MKILRLSYINFKRLSKNMTSIAIMLIAPLVIILGLHFISNIGGYGSNIEVAFNIEDHGTYGEEILEDLGFKENIFYEDEGALELLEKNQIVALYTIPEDFTEKIKNGEKPIIKSYKREEGNTTTPLEANLNNKINTKIKEEILLKNHIIKSREELYKFKSNTLVQEKDKHVDSKINGDLYMAMLMIIYFIILSSTSIGDEMLKLRKQNVLSRAMTTANKGYEIMGSLFLAILILSIVSNLLVLFISKLIIGYPIIDFYIIFINIALASMFSIALTIFLTRITDDPTLVSLGTAIYAVASFFLSMMALESDFYSKVPRAIINLGKFMPQYWLLDSIENAKLFPNIVVLLLMILALFTAGNYKFRDFVNRG
ncbi:ABC transporter permease [Clostridium sp. Cult3]|uniref:ABC transporter permease n=1 Tax=Clostridium sp. Cult3 TaxID=2079004 RepID=UPI001F3EE116|nr:ABC transporter permease [Clostridium sp. Cult3]MCF6460296.1 ABC transporter permease [Clostridium sp. Cult3]